jgi:hypothetical protein
MDTIDRSITEVTDATVQPLRLCVTESARELLALQVLVRQVIPMLEAPETVCTGKRLQLARNLKTALCCSTDHPDDEELRLPVADGAAEEEYGADYWTREEQP